MSNFKHLPKLVRFRAFSSAVLSKSELTITPLKGDDAGIVVFSLNRPDSKNSLNKSLANSLLNGLEVAKYDNSCRVVVIRSNVPNVFCAGADLKERLTLSETEVKIFVSRLRALMSTIENLPVPVISAIDGVALGGGLEMALACDMRVASENAKMGLVETRLAIIPGAGGTQRLPRLVGKALAKELIFTARVFSGTEALKMGVVNHSVPQNENGDSAYLKSIDIAREILPNGPVGVKMAKEAINRGSETDIATGCALEELCYAQVVPTQDRIEGLKAFREKRKPHYIGK